MLKKSGFFFNFEIPSNIEFFYCNKKRFIVIKSQQKVLSLKTKLQLKIKNKKPFIKITNNFFKSKVCHFNKKNIVKLKKILKFTLLKKFVDVMYNFYTTLRLKGVGYKFFILKNYNFQVFQLNLGFSHKIFIKPFNLFKLILKKYKIVVSSFSFQNLTYIASLIRLLKKPDLYKGKGISYEYEVIKLKQGKKI